MEISVPTQLGAMEPPRAPTVRSTLSGRRPKADGSPLSFLSSLHQGRNLSPETCLFHRRGQVSAEGDKLFGAAFLTETSRFTSVSRRDAQTPRESGKRSWVTWCQLARTSSAAGIVSPVLQVALAEPVAHEIVPWGGAGARSLAHSAPRRLQILRKCRALKAWRSGAAIDPRA